MNSDFRELLQCFAKRRVRYLVVGGYAVIHYAQPRFTRDLDLWIEPLLENARRVARSFLSFGIPLGEVAEADLAKPGTQYILGRPPVMLDFLTSVPRWSLPPAGRGASGCVMISEVSTICTCLIC